MKINKSCPKERILEAALELFYTQGYMATGVNQIIAQAGVAKASFYQHYPSKEELGLAYLEERKRLMRSNFEDALSQVDTPYKKLMLCFDLIEDLLLQTDYRGCAFANMASELPEFSCAMRRVVSEHKDHVRALFIGLVKELKKSSPKYGHINTTLVSDTFCLLFEGAIVTAQSMRSVAPFASARKVFSAMLKLK